MKGQYDLYKKIAEVGERNCFISEMTIAELKYGVENSNTMEAMRIIVETFIPKFTVIPIYKSLDIYAKEKASLRKRGLMIDDFDILIAATAVTYGFVMVTNNTNHFNRITDIELEDWTVS